MYNLVGGLIMGFFRYPGGKSKLAKFILPKIEAVLSSDIEYREPFFGGGSIGLSVLDLYVDRTWINDYDYGIHCLWHSVINFPHELIELVNNFDPTVESFYMIKDKLNSNNLLSISEDDKVVFGFYKLAIHQISYSGLGTKSGGPLGGKEQKSKYNISCRWSPKYISEKIYFYHNVFLKKTIRHSTCSCFDFSALITDDSEKSFLYLDPPYYVKGNELYQFSFSMDDHKRLRDLLVATKHLWLLSYDFCEEVEDLYKDIAHIEYISSVNYSINTSRA